MSGLGQGTDYPWDTPPDTYEAWVPWIKKRWNNRLAWQRVDNWFFPTPQNTTPMHKGQFYHICMANWLIDHNSEGKETVSSGKEGCPACGEYVPENIKMIAMLLSW